MFIHARPGYVSGFTDGVGRQVAMPVHSCACPAGTAHHPHPPGWRCPVVHRYYVPPRLGDVGIAGVMWREDSVYGEPGRLRWETVEMHAGAFRNESIQSLPLDVLTCLWGYLQTVLPPTP